MSRMIPLGAAMALLLALAAGLGLSAPVPEPGEKDLRSPQQIEEAQRELGSLRRQAERPNPDPEELWAAWQRFQVEYPGTPEWMKAAEIMRAVPSPLDKLDREQIPAADRPPWLPQEVVAVLGENRGRHWRDVHAVAVSPDGKLVASSAEAVRLWDAATMHERRLFKHDDAKWDANNYSWAVAFAPKAPLLALAHQAVVELWDLSNGEPKLRATLEGTSRWDCRQLSFSGDGRTLAASFVDRTVLWDLGCDPPKQLRTFDKGLTRAGVWAVLSADGRWLADDCGTHSLVRSVRVWDLKAAEDKEPVELEGSQAPIAFSADGKTLAAVMPHLKVTRLWDMSGKAPAPVRDLCADDVPDRAMAFSPDGAVLACLGFRTPLRLWPLNDAKRKEWRLSPLQTHEAFEQLVACQAAAFFPDGKTLALGCEDGTVRLWDVAQGRERFAPEGRSGLVNEAAFSPDCKWLATAGEDRSLRLWDLTGVKPVERVAIKNRPGAVTDVAFAPQGRFLASRTRPTAPKEKTLRFWDLSDPQPKVILPFQARMSDWEYNFAFSADGKRFACSGQDDREVTTEHGRRSIPNVRLWDFEKGQLEERATIVPEPMPDEPDNSSPPAILDAFSPDGKLLVVLKFDHWRVWSVDSPIPKELCAKKFDPATSGMVAFSPDGKLLASFDSEEAPPDSRTIYGVWLWSVMNGGVKEWGHFRMTDSPPLYLFFLPDAKTLVTLDGEHRLDFWEADTGRKLREIALPGSARPALAPDGRHLALANTNGTVYILRIAPRTDPAAER